MTKLLDMLAFFLDMRPSLEARTRRQFGARVSAEDVLHDAWLKLSAIDEDVRIDNPAAYISRTVQNTAFGIIRKEARRADIDAAVEMILWEDIDRQTPEQAVVARDLLRKVQVELDSLPERTRIIFLKNRIDGQSHRNIALELGITEEAVYYHIRRALDRLAAVREQL